MDDDFVAAIDYFEDGPVMVRADAVAALMRVIDDMEARLAELELPWWRRAWRRAAGSALAARAAIWPLG